MKSLRAQGEEAGKSESLIGKEITKERWYSCKEGNISKTFCL